MSFINPCPGTDEEDRHKTKCNYQKLRVPWEVKINSIFEGTIHDKQIISYDPKISCTEESIGQYLEKYNRNEMLRCLALASYRLFKDDGKLEVVGVPIIPYILHQAIIRSAKYCGTSTNKCPDEKALAYIFRACHALADNSDELPQDSLEIWMLYSYRQFPFQDRYFNALARTIYLYRDLWKEVKEAKQIQCLEDIKKVSGVSLEEIILYFHGAMASNTGFIFEYKQSELDVLSTRSGIFIEKGSHIKFLQWCSGTCDQLLVVEETQMPPLAIYPIIKTEFIPPGSSKEVYMISSYEYLLQKCTFGIFHLLSGMYDKGGGDNQFRVCFGKVFEAYVGKLLTYSLTSWKVLPEIAYKKQRDTIDSSDWFALKGDRLIVFDVKHSSLSLESKVTGDFSLIKKDLSKNLIKAVKQIDRTIKDLQSGVYNELSPLKPARQIQGVVVLNDTLHNSNFIGRRLIHEELGDLDFDLQVINIGEFEDLLANLDKKENLFGLLAEKTKYFKEMDFKEFLIRKNKRLKGIRQHGLLCDAYGSIFPKK